jgi:hypothetical protein
MVRRKLNIPERGQAVGMHNGGFSSIRVADHFRDNQSIIVRLMVLWVVAVAFPDGGGV